MNYPAGPEWRAGPQGQRAESIRQSRSVGYGLCADFVGPLSDMGQEGAGQRGSCSGLGWSMIVGFGRRKDGCPGCRELGWLGGGHWAWGF